MERATVSGFTSRSCFFFLLGLTSIALSPIIK